MNRLFTFPSLAVVATFALGMLGVGGTGCGEHEPLPAVGGGDGLELQIGGGIELGSLSYSVSGNGFSKTGTVDTSGSTTLAVRLSGIPEGKGYTVVVTAVAAGDARITCRAEASFDVSAGAITRVMIRLQCRLPPRTGTVVIDGTVNLCPRIDAVDVSPAEVVVGKAIALSAQAVDVDGVPAPLAFTWTSAAGSLTGAGAAQATLTCAQVGPGAVTLTVTDGDCSDTLSVPITCSAAPAADAGVPPDAAAPVPQVKVNEVESNGGTPGDWVELYNLGAGPANVGGWVFKDNDDTHAYSIPAGTSIPAGGFLVLEEAAFGFGLGGADSARVFDGNGALVDSHSWTAHAAITYSRCPDGTGSFAASASTKGAANACGASADAGAPDSAPPADAGAPDSVAPDAPLALEPWPGRNMVADGDGLNQFGDNLSGLTYQPATATTPPILWAVLNSPSLLYRLQFDGTIWNFATADDWGAGKALRYPGGTGNPDCEGVTKADWATPFFYVATERNNEASSVSRISILRFDGSAPGAALTATHEWNLNVDLPALGANLGSEAVTWVPDGYLVSNGFIDEARGQAYDPAAYGDHAGGLFLVGIEGNGIIYAYALEHVTGAFTRVATIPSGHPGVMGLEFDRDAGALWAGCDNTCANTQHILGVVNGRFAVRRRFARPSTLPDSNNEGIAFSPDSECVAGQKPFFWSDDSHFAGHALRIDSVPCGPLF